MFRFYPRAAPVSLLAFCLAAEPVVAGDVISMPDQQIFEAAADSWLEEKHPETNYGTDDRLSSMSDPGEAERPVLYFDLSGLANDRVTTSAVLKLYVAKNDASGKAITIRRITSPWTELGANWNDLGEAFDPSTVWGTFRPTSGGIKQIDVTALVEEWRKGTFPNYGIMLISSSRGIESRIASREWSTPNQRPRLIVNDDLLPAGLVNLRVTKTVSDSIPNEGDTIDYTVGVSNLSINKATGVVVADPLPAGVSFRDAEPSQGSYSPITGRWLVGTLDGGKSASLMIYVDVDAGTAGSRISNIASVLEIDQGESLGGNNTGVADIVVQAADLEITKIVDDPTPNEGDTVAYTVGLYNHGPDTATRIEVLDQLPPGLTYQADSTSHGDYNPETEVWKPGELAAGESAALVLTARVDVGTGGSVLVNTASVALVDQGDPVSLNNTGFAAVDVQLAELRLFKVVTDSSPNEGDAIGYSIALSNLGPDDATGVEVTDLLPAGVIFQADSTNQGTYDAATGIWNVGTVLPGTIAGLLIEVEVDSTTAGDTISNHAAISAVDTADPLPGNEADSAAITVQAADLEIAKTVDDGTPDEGDTVTFTVLLKNHGPDPATSVQLTDVLPAGLTYQSDTPSQGVYLEGSGLWAVGTVASSDSATLTLTAGVDPGTSGTMIHNTAAVTGVDQADPGPGNESDFADVVVSAADLEVTKTVDDPAPNEGDIVSYTVTVFNHGPGAASGIAITDLLPAGVSYDSDTPSQGLYADGTGLWTVGTIAYGDSATLVLAASVDPGTAGSTIRNTAAVSAVDQGDPIPGNQSDFADLTVQSADLEVIKTVGDTNPTEGDTIVFTVRVANHGPDIATGITVTDLLPGGLTYQSDSPSHGSYVPGTGLWTVGSVAVADTAVLILSSTVDGGTAGTSIQNAAAVTAVDQGDPDPGNENDFADLTVESADLVITKRVDNPSPNEGDLLTYTIVLSNFGPDAATGILVADALPSGLSFQSDTPSQGTYSNANGLWTVGNVVSADSVTLVLTATVDPATAGTTIRNTASVSAVDQGDPAPGNESDFTDVTVQSADLSVTKTVNNPTPEEGSTVTYTVTVTNDGPDAATGVAVTDLLPAGVSYQAGVPSQGSYGDGSGLWTVGSVANGSSVSLILIATVDPLTAGNTITNTATITAVNQFDPVSGNESDFADIDPIVAGSGDSADLRVTKTVDDPAPNEGDSISYAVVLKNEGPDASSGVEVTDLLPPGVTFSSDAPSQGSYTAGTGSWTVGAVAAGDSATLLLAAAVDPATSGLTIVNTASVTAMIQSDPVGTNNNATAGLTVQSADLELTNVVDFASPNEEDVVGFTITVFNHGPDAATGVVVTDALPAGVTYDSHALSQGSYVDTPGDWTIGTIASGDSALAILGAIVDTGTAGTTIQNDAVVTAVDQGDPAGGNESGSAEITVQSADLQLAKAVDNPTPNEGDTVTYTITVRNHGPDDATDVKITDLLPSGIAYQSDVPSQGGYASGSGLWTVGTVASGDTATLALSGTLDAGTTGGSIQNNAAVTAVDQADPAGGNESDSITVSVQAADLVVAKTVDQAAPNEGDAVRYTIVLTNQGPDAATGIAVIDSLPVGITYVSDAPSQGSFDGTSVWTIGSLADGDSATLVLDAGVDPGTAGQTIRNTAAVTAVHQGDPAGGDESDFADVTIQSADLAVTKIVDNAIPSEADTVTFTVTLENLGPDAATGITVTDLLPAGLTVLSDSTSQGVYFAGTGLWVVGAVADGDSASLSIAASVDAGTAGTTLNNTASVTASDLSDPVAANDADAAAITVQSADLAVTKTVEDPTPYAGESVTFTVTVENLGPDPATAVEITDALPAGLTYQADSTSQGSYASGAGVWTVGSLAAGDSASLWLTAGVDFETVGETMTNVATVTGLHETDPASGNDADSVAVETYPDPGVAVRTVTGPASASEGQAGLVFQFRVENFGGDPVSVDSLALRFTRTTPGDLNGDFLVTPDPANADTLAAAAEEWISFTVDLLSATAGAVTVDGHFSGTDVRSAVEVQDTGADTVATLTIQVPPDLDGEPETLQPPAVQIGAGAMLTVNVTNLGEASVTLDPSSRLRIAAPGDTIDAPLDPGGLTAFATRPEGVLRRLPATTSLSFGPLTVPSDFPPGQHPIFLDLTGVDSNGSPYTDISVLPDSIAAASQGVTLAGTQPNAPVAPGSERWLFTLAVASSMPSDLELDEVVFENVTTGPGAPADLDAELGTLTLFRDDGDGAFDARLDTHLTTTAAAGGAVSFDELELSIPTGTLLSLHVTATPALTARDSDALDLAVAGEGSFVFGESVSYFNTFPLSPAGARTVNGMVAAQIESSALPTDLAVAGDKDLLALDVTAPANGYETDTLGEIRIVNQGDAEAGTDLDQVVIWVDGGDGEFDPGSGTGSDDVALGAMTWTGSEWFIDGFSQPVQPGGLRLFAAVDVAENPTPGRTIRLAVPTGNGFVMSSDNDGPVDETVASPTTLVIRDALSALTVSASDQSGGALLPGEDGVEVFRLEIVNAGAVAETLTTIHLTNLAAGAGSPAELDADWMPLTLVAGTADDLAGGGVRSAPAGFAAGVAAFPDLGIPVAAENATVILVKSGASLSARDGDVLDLAIADTSTDLVFQRTVNLTAPAELDPPGSFAVDGMAAAQIEMSAGETATLLTGSTRNLAFEFVVPPNGYAADTLRFLNVRNVGDAVPTDLARVEAWVDSDGDAAFEPDGDDELLGELLYTGDRWQITGLSETVGAAGLRVFIACDVSEDAAESRTVHFALPNSPGLGIGMQSTNDGPRDAERESPTTMTITEVDRVTITTGSIEPGPATPGETWVPLAHLHVANVYTVSRTLTGLAVTNASAGPGSQEELDLSLASVQLVADADSSGDPGPGDLVLARSSFTDGRASFTGFSWEIPADEERQLFVTGEVSLERARDGDLLAARVDEPASVTFLDPTTTLSASFPLESTGARTVDGMVAAQIENVGAPVATLGPGEGPVLALDVIVPANGYASDTLEALRIENLGTATSADLDEMRLWRDDGDELFEPAEDTDLGPMAPVFGEWVSGALSETIDSSRLHLFVSVTSSSALADSAAVRLGIPIEGVTVSSGNDGPMDTAVANPDEILLSTAALLATLEIEPGASTIGQPVTARMFVRNLGDSTITGIAPTVLTPMGSGALTLTLPASPDSFALAPGADSVFTWTFDADSSGSLRFSGSAVGTEAGSGLTRQSPAATSNEHEIFAQAQELALFPVESMPFSINRGQTDVVPLSLTLTNGGDADASAIRITGLSFRLEEEAGGGIVPAELLSRVTVHEGSNVYLDKGSLETSGAKVDLPLDEPVLVESQTQVTLSLSLAISDSTVTPSFRLKVVDETWLDAEDATNGVPVTIALEPGESFPVQSGLARVVAEATELEVALAPDSDEPVSVGQGQEGVSLLALRMDNPGPAGLGADARLASFEVSLIDSGGVICPEPWTHLSEIRVFNSVQTLVERAVTEEDYGTISLALSSLLSVPVNTPVDVFIEGDLADAATAGIVRLQMADANLVDARDANTGAPLPVSYASDPVQGPPVTIQAQAETVLASGEPRLPASAPVGEMDLPVLTLVLEHPGSPETGAIRCDSLVVQCRDQANGSLLASTYIDRARVLVDETQVGLVADLPGQGEFPIPLSGVTLDPGESVSLEIRVDLEVTAPATLFQMGVASDGIFAIDANLGSAVNVSAGAGAEFPLTSGLTQLRSPARELVVGFAPAMPAVLVADGRTVTAARFTLTNSAAATAGDIFVDRLELLAADRDFEPAPIGAALSRVQVLRGDEIWGDSGELPADATSAVVVSAEPLSLAPGSPVELEVQVTLREGGSAGNLRLGCNDEGIGVVQPESALLSVSVLAQQGTTFPFWTEPGNFTGVSLADSYSNFPNPFAAGRAETRFAFFLEQPAQVTLHLWSARGAKVRTLVDGVPYVAGLHQETAWDGRNGRGDVVVNGVYLAEILVAFEDGTQERVVRKVAVVR